jgi:hypothetical protein
MTAKEYLQLYRKYERYYNLVIEQIKSIDNEMISLKSPTFDERVQTSPKKDPIGEMVCALEKEKGKLGMRMTEYKAKMTLIQRQVAEMDKTNSDYYVILLLRYILFKDWQFICDSLHLSRTQANRLNGQALLEFDAKFGQIYEKK